MEHDYLYGSLCDAISGALDALPEAPENAQGRWLLQRALRLTSDPTYALSSMGRPIPSAIERCSEDTHLLLNDGSRFPPDLHKIDQNA